MEETNNVAMTGKQNLIQFGKFVLFSISAGVIQVLVFTLLEEVFHLSTGRVISQHL